MNYEFVRNEPNRNLTNLYLMKLGNAIMDKEREDILLRLDRLIGDKYEGNKFDRDSRRL